MAALSAGQRFMVDLLVTSLMADGGLESSFESAFRRETHVSDVTELCALYVQSSSDNVNVDFIFTSCRLYKVI